MFEGQGQGHRSKFMSQKKNVAKIVYVTLSNGFVVNFYNKVLFHWHVSTSILTSFPYNVTNHSRSFALLICQNAPQNPQNK